MNKWLIWLATKPPVRRNFSGLVVGSQTGMGARTSGPSVMNSESTKISAAETHQADSLLIVVPCLNEAPHIAGLLAQLTPVLDKVGGRIVVVDGGSTDGSREIVADVAARHSGILLLDNLARVQSAGVNAAVRTFGDDATYLVRIDAHCSYPDDFCERLLDEAKTLGVASVVVSMEAKGQPAIQRTIAAAQNSVAGNGGSKHRLRASGEFVDHGHHALITIEAFRAVGGYDPSFSHNEDAELDFRLVSAGYKIWLTAKTHVTYYPREGFSALAGQYFNYGKGRAKNLLKHGIFPKLRQTKVLMVLPAVFLASLASVNFLFAVPFILWVAYCLFAGIRIAWEAQDARLMAAGFSAMIMHLSWSMGFWYEVLRQRSHRIQRRSA